jgi:hypothetical protein
VVAWVRARAGTRVGWRRQASRTRVVHELRERASIESVGEEEKIRQDLRYRSSRIVGCCEELS